MFLLVKRDIYREGAAKRIGAEMRLAGSGRVHNKIRRRSSDRWIRRDPVHLAQIALAFGLDRPRTALASPLNLK